MKELIDFESNLSLEALYRRVDKDSKQLIEEITLLATADCLVRDLDLSLEALKDKSNVTIRADIEHLLSAMLTQVEYLASLSQEFGCQPYQLRFSEDVHILRDNLFQVAETRRYGEPSTTWHQDTKHLVPKLRLSEELKSLLWAGYDKGKLNPVDIIEGLSGIDHRALENLVKLNQDASNIVSRALTAQKIQHGLSQSVIGQDGALDQLCRGYVASSLRSQIGPRLIYTFVGPSGVGKTYLAKQLFEQVQKHELCGYDFNVFNMEHYSDQRDSTKLFGSGIQYADANLGELTNLVRTKPRQILLFDEIEKAHSSVLQSLLSVLDSGKIKDQTSQEEVDFSQCIVVFTTNLGQDVVSNNRAGHSVSVFDILRSSHNPSNKVKLSPEFVNRLAKGYAIIFNELTSNHLINLAERELKHNAQAGYGVTFEWSEGFSAFLLKSLSPDISVRRLKSQVNKLQAEVLSKMVTALSSSEGGMEGINNSPPRDITFRVSAQRDNQPPCNLLLLDDDQRIFDKLAMKVDETDISLCSGWEDLPMALEKRLPDALLIDIDTVSKHGSTLHDAIDRYIGSKKIRLFTFQINSKQPINKVSSHHAVREHFDISIDDMIDTGQFEHCKVNVRTFDSMLSRVRFFLRTEKMLNRVVNRRESISYHCELTKADHEFAVEFVVDSIDRVVSGTDISGNDLFSMTLPTTRIRDVIGLDRAKKRLSDVITWIKSPEKLSQVGIKKPTGFLLSGPPGTGKTFLAKAFAGESELPFFMVSGAELSSSNAGGTTDNIKRLFKTARKYAPSFVFIDEIDAIAAKRSSSGEGAARDRNLTVNSLLTELDGIGTNDDVFVMAATNHPEHLDSALVRPGRFDEVIYCDLPNASARRTFFRRFAKNHFLTVSESDLNDLVAASRGLSSAAIDQVFREVLYEAVGKEITLDIALLLKTMVRVSYGTPSENIILSDKEKLRTAYHEAGHLLAVALLFPTQEIDFVTIEPRNHALGFVAQRPQEKYEGYSKRTIESQLEVLLAGKVAEKLHADNDLDVSTGASNDISKATQLAMHAIYEGGLDSTVGSINIPMLTKFEESDLLLHAQNAVQTWIGNAEISVTQRLTEHRAILDTLAYELYDKESMLGEGITQLLNKLLAR